MISVDTILNEIEKHTRIAKGVNDNQLIREHIVAIRALCDVLLAEQNSNKTVTFQKNEELDNVQSIQMKNTASLPSNKLKEEDANGESLFDF
ncbi:hypothetical protein CD30_01025 [Ureibacillus massiliensis 4400831 = CIP 108448 = CCUG 49529]|uniref:Uncharacterized protein n=1 Tax=Ureibacillus massiliensis 4400831 = CIP 108448 = CCUG 49529 TaxID=1211035 RepID=A0A0A3J5W4_9BACL|nr:YwdI family protein [Ureibacillus massiliensis]KGR92424.1 hypothetical protein CD30_01025 [Ureibacillus massiliensis 4400831 = CIP 108448 = CCUG 49529]